MGVDALSRRRAVFLDRDGVINRNVWNPVTQAYESPLRIEDIELCPGVIPALAQLREAQFLLFVVSNQPNYAKGKASLEALEMIHRVLMEKLVAGGIQLDGSYYCLHHPEGVIPSYSDVCICRKPSPYFLLRVCAQFGIALESSWMVGDRETDIACGKAAGSRTIHVKAESATAYNDTYADAVVENLAEAVDVILSEAPA